MAKKNSTIKAFTGKTSIPASSTKTGTIETQGANIIGTGTKFLTELPVGSWVVDLTQDEVIKVISVKDDESAVLSEPFPVDIPASTPLDAISEKDANVVALSVSFPLAGPGGGEVDAVAFDKGESFSFSKESRDMSATNDFIDPVIANAPGFTAKYITLQ